MSKKTIDDLLNDDYDLIYWDEKIGILYNDPDVNGTLTSVFDVLEVAIPAISQIPDGVMEDSDFNKILDSYIKRIEEQKR